MCEYNNIINALNDVIEMVNEEIKNKKPVSKNGNFANVTTEIMILQRLCDTAQYIENVKQK